MRASKKTKAFKPAILIATDGEAIAAEHPASGETANGLAQNLDVHQMLLSPPMPATIAASGGKAVHPISSVWAMDVVHDQLATGKKLRVLTVVDTFSRYVPVLDVRYSYRGEDVVATLDRVCRKVGYPKTIRVDQGTEFVSRDMDLWAYQRGVVLDFSRPGKPTDNAFIEAFNGRFRTECLNQHWFMTLADAAEKLEAWRRYYNEERPHGAIGNKVPIMLTKSGGVTSPSP